MGVTAREFGACCGMCGRNFMFETKEGRDAWLKNHDGTHLDFVSYFRVSS